MPTVRADVRVPASARNAFDFTQDYYLRQAWDPFAKEIRLLDGAVEPAVGVRVWVKAWYGLTMEVEYSAVSPREVVAVKMQHGPHFLSSFAGAWRFRPVTDHETEVEFIYSFSTRWRRLRPVLDPIIVAIFGRDIRRRLKALKQALADGETVPAATD